MDAAREQPRQGKNPAPRPSTGDARLTAVQRPVLHRPAVRWWGTSSLNLAARQPIAHAIMFYLLSTAAMLIFAPCVLVPIWNHVQELSEAERALRAMVLQLRAEIDKNEIRIDALKNDPLVVDRVARRELNQRSANEQHVRWTPAELAGLRLHIPHELNRKPELPPASMPVWVENARKWLPAWPWPELFAKSPNREFLLVMAGCLLLTAFVLYAPRAECRVRDEE